MTVEESRGSIGTDGGSRDHFPVGMRVLVVDGDLTCLKVLETLLLHCQYHVTTTNQAIKALKLLRENKDKFDLVISDVHMPDMDGFKLLELVGLEMDLPVIMMSANGETKMAMKGITCGAVDYLLKPVRLEELRNIWQHVIRRRKFDHRDPNNLDNGEDYEKPQNANLEGGQGAVSNGSSNHNGKLNRERKDQNDEDEDDCEENMHENEDPCSQKKPRVVWSVELHQEFVAAVNQLGIDKAVPKRILDLMHVEGLTRENVASHLQKYRLYLKRLGAVASQQANMVTALGGRDLSYLPMYSLDGFGNSHALVASGQSPALSSYRPNGMLNIMSPTALGPEGLARSGMVHSGHSHNSTSHPINDLHRLQLISQPGNQHGNLHQGMPTSFEVDKLQQQKRMPVANNHLPGGLSGSGLATGGSSNSFVNVTDSPLLLQAQQQHIRSRGLTNQSSLGTPSMSSDPFERSAGVSSYSPHLGRCNDTWQGAVPLNGYSAKTLPMTASSTQDYLSRITGAHATLLASQIDSNPLNISSGSVVVARQQDPVVGRDGQCLASSLGKDTSLMLTGIDEDSKFLNFRSTGNSRQKWEEPEKDHTSEPSLIFSSSLNCPWPNQPIIDTIAENQGLNNGLDNKRIDTSMIGQTNFSAPLLTQSCKIDKSTSDGLLKYKDEYILGTLKLTGGLNSLNSDGCCFDDLVNAMIKRFKMMPSMSRSNFVKNRSCNCGRKAVVKISELGYNPGRPYFCCPNRYDNLGGRKCGYWKWLDEEIEVDSQSERITIPARQMTGISDERHELISRLGRMESIARILVVLVLFLLVICVLNLSL